MKKLSLFVLIGALVAMVSCKKDSLEDYDTKVVNNTNNFSLQVADIKHVNKSSEYDWENEGTKAEIQLSCTIDDGSGTIKIKDNDGNIVFSNELDEIGVFESDEGTSGMWKIIFEFNDASGSLNVNVKKADSE